MKSTAVQPLFQFLKPHFLLRPKVLLERISYAIKKPNSAFQLVNLPWGHKFRVNINEAVGREIYKQKVFDLAVTEIATRILSPGDQAVDVGANIGYMTSLFASRVGPTGRVHAFEPVPEIYSKLKVNVDFIDANRKKPFIKLHPFALGESISQGKIITSGYFEKNEGTAYIEPVKENQDGVVLIKPLSEVIDKNEVIKLMKVDVEGFELNVLKGAKSFLKSGKIIHIIYEDHEAETSGLKEYLTEFGYQVGTISYDFWKPVVDFSLQKTVDLTWESQNYIATLDRVGLEKMIERKGWRSVGL